MERFVLSRRFDDYFGITLAMVNFIAIFLIGAPAWTFVPIMIAGLNLLMRLHLWAERRVTDE